MKKKYVSGFIKRNLLVVLLALFVCLGIGMSVYLESDLTDSHKTWSMPGVNSTSTPTAVLLPAEGWWEAIATPAR